MTSTLLILWLLDVPNVTLWAFFVILIIEVIVNIAKAMVNDKE